MSRSTADLSLSVSQLHGFAVFMGHHIQLEANAAAHRIRALETELTRCQELLQELLIEWNRIADELGKLARVEGLK